MNIVNPIIIWICIIGVWLIIFFKTQNDILYSVILVPIVLAITLVDLETVHIKKEIE